MPMVSYAQNREDVLLQRLFPHDAHGFYVDVGAHDPTENSVTKHFYDRGWKGINIEPLPSGFKRFAAQRPRDLNLNLGVSDSRGARTFYEFPSMSVLSTFSRVEAERHRSSGRPFVEYNVPVTTLAALCEEHVRQHIDFLSIDVEGYEGKVLQGGDWKRWRPRIVLIEATQPNSTVPTHEHWEHLLLNEDYLFAYFDGLNRFYVRAEDRELLSFFSTPVNVFDMYIPYEYLSRILHLERELRSVKGA